MIRKRERDKFYLRFLCKSRPKRILYIDKGRRERERERERKKERERDERFTHRGVGRKVSCMRRWHPRTRRLSCRAANAVHTFWSRLPRRRGRCRGSRSRRMTDSCRYFFVPRFSLLITRRRATTLSLVVPRCPSLFLAIPLVILLLDSSATESRSRNDAVYDKLLQVTRGINRAKRKRKWRHRKLDSLLFVTSCLRKTREKCRFFQSTISVEFRARYVRHLRYARAMHGRYDGQPCSVVARSTAVRSRLNPRAQREAERRKRHTQITRVQTREHTDSGSDNTLAWRKHSHVTFVARLVNVGGVVRWPRLLRDAHQMLRSQVWCIFYIIKSRAYRRCFILHM